MKKVKILVASVLFCAMGYTGYTAHERMTISEAEKFMKANIEALTDGEIVISGQKCSLRKEKLLTELLCVYQEIR